MYFSEIEERNLNFNGDVSEKRKEKRLTQCHPLYAP